jgi:Ni,Fe-hydrogenase I small subunit
MEGNPTGAMGLADYLGWDFKSTLGLPIVNVPGCPVQPDNFMETVLYLLFQVSGLAPMIPLDEQLRPTWLFGKTVHEGCDRAGYYEQGDFAHEYGSPKCIVKLGCWGPVVNCNVTKRGWMMPSAAVRMSAAFVSAVRCPVFPINLCRLWTNRPAQNFRRARSASTVRLCALCEA